MEAPFQIVGCVLASKPAAELIDAFVAQARRERAAVLVKSAQGATFVRFNAPDVSLVALACRTLRGALPALLRFGFAVGVKEPAAAAAAAAAGPEGLNISTRSIVQANDLAAGAGDGEVVVSPQLAVLLIEAGFALRTKQIHLPGGRTVPACTVDLGVGTAPDAKPQKALSKLETPTALLQKADALGNVMASLMAQAEEMARKQGDLEARQDAVLGKMTLVDEGSVSARHLDDLEAELDAQVQRVQVKLEAIEQLERRVGQVQGVLADVERKVADQLRRRAEVENLKALGDGLVEQLVDAQHKLDGMVALQERLLPLTSQVATLAQTLEQSQRALATVEGRLGDLDRSTQAVDERMKSIEEREALVQAVKVELDTIRVISAGSRLDLQFVTEHGSDIAELRAKVQELLGHIEETDGKIATIESHRRMVEEVQSRASAITHMLGDITLNLEMLSEQRAMIDHVGEKLARLDFTVQEAQNTLRALQREREVAERVEQGIKALRARSG